MTDAAHERDEVGGGHLRFDGAEPEAFQRAPGIGVGQCLLGMVGEGLQAGGGDGLQRRLGGGKCR
ncbi:MULTISPECIES: hypothetical protein [Streptomyces]|uniref:Uncharacterized protein n=2 Tax=Streptomyces TaxID=1883 RepID=A0A2N8PHD4_STRNR|nr:MULTISPECIES: hypothetical protein [Streptomyces]PNE40443.1 hypothetical protein AOB60_05750 [Streptomyces noursei]SHM90651.1 hypothetical protein SAMN05216268_11625 [Streptomyces yunnanensis]